METTSKAVRNLMDQHKKLKGLFQQSKAARVRASEMERGVARELLMELDLTFQIKHNLLYPALKNSKINIEEKTLIDECSSRLENLMNQLEVLQAQKSENQVRFNEFTAEAFEFFETEEQYVFSKVDELQDKEQQDLIQKMEEEKKRIHHLPKYRDALPSKVQNPDGGEQKRIA